MGKPIEITLANLGGGDLLECATQELRKICDNIADLNVKAEAKRKLIITIEVKPDAKRVKAAVTYGIKTSMPGPDAGNTMAYIAMGKGSKAISLFEIPSNNQPPLFDGEDEEGEAPTPGISPLKAKEA